MGFSPGQPGWVRAPSDRLPVGMRLLKAAGHSVRHRALETEALVGQRDPEASGSMPTAPTRCEVPRPVPRCARDRAAQVG